MSDPCFDNLMGKVPEADRVFVDNIIKILREEKRKPFLSGFTDPQSEYRKAAMTLFESYKKGLINDKIEKGANILKGKKLNDFVSHESFSRAAIAANSGLEKIGSLFTQWSDHGRGKGLEAVLTGTGLRGVDGGRFSTNAVRNGASEVLSQAFIRNLKPEDFSALRKMGHYDNARIEWFEIQNDGKPGITGDPSALRIAQAANDLQRATLLMLNRGGAFINDLKGRTGLQSHDPIKIANIGKEKWIEIQLNNGWIDLDRTMGHGLLRNDIRDILSTSFDNITKKGNPIYDENADSLVRMVNMPSNAARALERGRHIFYTKIGGIEYAKMFSKNDSFIEELNEMVYKAASAYSRMSIFGTNPDATFHRKLEEYDLTDSEKRYLRNLYEGETKGMTSIPGESTGAKWVWFYTQLNNLRLMGKVSLSQPTDFASRIISANLSGYGIFESQHAVFTSFFKSLTPKDKVRWANITGVGAQTLMGVINDRISGIDGTMNKGIVRANNLQFMLTGMTWLTNSNRVAHSQSLSVLLGSYADTPMNELNQDMRDMLSGYGITSLGWDLFRKSVEEHGGQKFISFNKVIDNVGLEKIKEAMISAGAMSKDLPPDRMDLAAEEYAWKQSIRMATLFRNESAVAMNEPGDFERNLLLNNTSADSRPGGAARLFAQYKSFGLSSVRLMDRIMLSRGGTSWGDAIANGKLPWGAIANYLVASLSMGFVVLVARQIANNETPSDPTDPEQLPYIITRAAELSGVASTYTSIVLGESGEFEAGKLASLAGPIGGDIFDIGRLMSMGLNASVAPNSRKQKKEFEKLRKQMFRDVVSRRPNFMYTSAMLDYMIIRAIENNVSRGTIKRKQKKLKEQGRDFLVKPER